VTGKNLVIDPAVHGEVTLVCSASLTPSAFYQVSLTVLDAHGWRAVPDPSVVKIVPAAHAPPRPVAGTADEIMTEVVEVKNVSVARLAPVIQPLLSTDGHWMAYTPSNLLVFSDRVSHTDRLVRVIHRLDEPGTEDLQIPAEDSAPSDP
jgi:general secretion pathway protein D